MITTNRFLTIAAWAVLAASAVAQNADDRYLCWRKSFGRGAGTVPGDCPPGTEKDAGLCYSTCKPGMKGVGPVCWSSCPAGFRDDGAFCAKPQPYGRGAGYALWDEKKCRAENGGNCEKNGLMWYPACKPGFHATGCCVCSPDCPAGMTDIGVSCAKQTYTRGVGNVPNCPGGKGNDAGLCYGSCPADFDAVGPVCWGRCPPDYPFPCGAGCAKSQATCAAATTDMTLSTVSVGINVLLMVAGVPGLPAVAKTAAQTGMTALGKTAEQGSRALFAQSMKTLANRYGREFAQEFVTATVKNVIKNPNPGTIYTAYSTVVKNSSILAANQLANEMGATKLSGQWDWTTLTAIDVTGVSSMVAAFAKYGACNVEDLASSTREINFGPGIAKPGDKRTVELTIQNPTVITEITSSPLEGCAIHPESDCIGRSLQPGEKCTVRVGVSGEGRIDGEIRIYTTAYDVIPFPVAVKANTDQTKAECGLVPNATEAVNLSAITGVWAWNNNQGQKVVIHNDGRVESFRGKGRASVLDPIKRTFGVTIGSSPAEVVTLSAEHDTLRLSSGSPAQAVRRPWDAGCNAGETSVAGLCYDVPPDYEITAPGFTGKSCPADWRSDGTRCYPPWSGPKVDFQADPKGTFTMRHPLVVTDCGKFAQTKGQKCPANFKNSGGPAGCSCEAISTSKDVKSIIGRMPSAVTASR